MLRPGTLALAAALVGLMGCASTEGQPEFGERSPISFSQIKASPDSFRGQSVVFGGEVLTARRLKDGTRIEILQLPLDGSDMPGFDLRESQGRFIAMHREFLDPATVPRGTRVTISGEVNGSTVLPLDETEYTYPVIDVRHLQVWPQGPSPQSQLYYAPYPYSWSPYWRPWPYW